MLHYCQISNEADPVIPNPQCVTRSDFYKQTSTQSPSLAENVAVKLPPVSRPAISLTDICAMDPDFATNPPSLSDYWVMLRLGAGRMVASLPRSLLPRALRHQTSQSRAVSSCRPGQTNVGHYSSKTNKCPIYLFE